jgi:hypothetical protein
MASGQLIVIYADSEKDTAIAYFKAAGDNLKAVASESFASSNISFDSYFLSVNESAQYGFVFPDGAIMPRVFYVDLTKSNETSQLKGYYPLQLKGFFYSALSKDHSPSSGTGSSAGSGWGNGYAYDRKCNAIDEFLKFLHLGTALKRVIYGTGAAFFGYNALNSNNNIAMAVNGGIAGGFGYLLLGKEDCPFDIPTLEKNGTTIAMGAGVSVCLLALYHFYLKDELKTRRVVRILRAANSGASTSPSRAVIKQPVRKRVKPKSVTVTKRF